MGNTDLTREREVRYSERGRRGSARWLRHRSFCGRKGETEEGGGGREARTRNSRRPVSKCYPACKKGQSSLRRARESLRRGSAWRGRPTRASDFHTSSSVPRDARNAADRQAIRRLSPLDRLFCHLARLPASVYRVLLVNSPTRSSLVNSSA